MVGAVSNRIASAQLETAPTKSRFHRDVPLVRCLHPDLSGRVAGGLMNQLRKS